MFELFEHTADLGLRVRAADLDTLFAEAARGLFSMVVEDLTTVRPERRIGVRLDADQLDYLLFDWLKALLYEFDARHTLLSRFEVKVDESGLSGSAWGEPLDRDRHILEHEVKAITYHGLRVEKADGEWLAEIIVDI